MGDKRQGRAGGLIPAERRQKILTLLSEHGGVLGVQEIAGLLGVSHMTVRRDLQVLGQSQLIVPVTGGAQLSERIRSEPSHEAKEVLAAEEKSRIGRAAAKMVPEHACIYLDAGTTTLALAHYISHRGDLTIVTNDFEVLNYLCDATESQIIHVGGQTNKLNRSSVGPLSTMIISALSVDVAFMSASSWDQRGVTTPDINKVTIKQAAIKASAKKILLCDSTKYAKVATYLAYPLTELDGIITDRALPLPAQKQIRLMDIDLQTV